MKLFLALLLSVACFAQTQTKVAPDCTLGTIVLISGQSSANYDNRTTSNNNAVPCTQWTLEYFTTNAGTITGSGVQIQVSGDTAGTPTGFALAVASTTTPSGRVQYNGSAGSATNGYYPWLRVTMGTGTASIRATLNGWREDQGTINSSTSSSGCVGTASTPCIVAGPDASGAAPTQSPVLTAGNDGAAVRTIATDSIGTQKAQGASTSSLPFAVTASGSTQIVGLTAGQIIRVYSIEFTPDTSGEHSEWTLVQGTGSNCVTGPATLTGRLSNVLAYSNIFDSPFVLTIANALCFNQASAITLHGTVWFDKR